MKAGWKAATLGDVSVVGAGNSAPQDKRLFEGGTFPFVRTSDVGKIRVGELYSAQDHLNQEGIQKLKLHRAGTILIPKSGASTFLDHRVVMGVDAYVSSHLATLWPKDGIIDGRYLFWVSQQIVASEVASDTSYPTLSLEQIKGIEIPLPPLEEQRRIVAVLDEAFAAIATTTANAEKNLANVRALFSAALEDVLDGERKGWPMISLRSAGKTVTGNTPKTSVAANFGDHIPFIKPGDFRPNGSLNYANEALSVQGASASRLIPAGSALMVCIGATIGKSGFTEAEVTANQQVNAFIPSAGLLGKFAFYQFLTKRFQRAVRSGSGQATLPIINKSKWSDLGIYVPANVQQQKAAVNLLDAIVLECDALEATFRKKMIALDALKQSLLHSAFTGGLTATIPETIAA